MAEPYELAALKVELKEFAHGQIGTHVLGEYWDQIDEWKKFYLRLVKAQRKAIEGVKGLLNEELKRIAKQQAEARQALFGMGMLALSFITGPLVSFVAGKIEHVWFPKLTSKVRERYEYLTVHGSTSHGAAVRGLAKRLVAESDYNQVHAKIYGDLSGQVVGLGINGALKVATPDLKEARNAVTLAQMSPDTADLETNLQTSLLTQAQATRRVILSLAMSIANNTDYGEQCLERLKGLYQGHVNPQRSHVGTLRNLAMKMIRDDIDRHRKQWANDWYFYGTNPPSATEDELREAITVELWAMWLLEQNFRVEIFELTDSQDGVTLRRSPYLAGKTFGNHGMPERIVTELAEYGVVEARNLMQHSANARRAAERKLRRGAEPPPRDVVEKDIRTVKRMIEDEEEAGQRPLIKVGDKVDAKGEVEQLERWAKYHPPVLSVGRALGTKRALPPIERVHSARGDR